MRCLPLLVLAGCSFSEPAVIATEFSTRAPALADEVVPAYTLTAADGRGLRLVAIDAKAVIEGPLAFTELHLKFENTENRVREGTFAITLPQQAAISRFAMVDESGIKEAEVVAKALARRAYEDFLHRGVDPALLEKAPGNQFTARVFPIPPRATKHLVLSYSQELANDGYVLPLRGLPKIDDVSIELTVEGTKQSLREKAWHPNKDFRANVVTTPAVGHGKLVAAGFDVGAASAGDDRPQSITVLVDTSASRAAGFTRYLGKVRALVHALGVQYSGIEVEVIAFDQEARSMVRGKAIELGDRATAALAQRGPGGASDLGVAARLAKGRVVIITDGVVTAGLEGTPLDKAFAADRVDVVLAGGIRDDNVARTLARAGKRSGDVFDLDRESIADIAGGLGQAIHVDVPILVTDAVWFYPRRLPSLRAGTQVTVFAKLFEPRTSIEARIGEQVYTAPIERGTPALVERAVARAQIEELEADLVAKPTEQTRAQIEKLSLEARVISSQTTMLVLESEDDYVRYGIDRKAVTNILAIGPRGLEHQKPKFVAIANSRRVVEVPEVATTTVTYPTNFRPAGDATLTRQQAIEQARHAGILGSTSSRSTSFSATSSSTSFGDGFLESRSVSGAGAGFGAGRYRTIGKGAPRPRARRSDSPSVTIAMPSVVQGSLDKSIIKRYIKRQLAKISYCYEAELLSKPHLEGTVQVQFHIGKRGIVTSATASGVDPKVASCVASVIKQIEFPTIVDGGVQVNYPFTFRSVETSTGTVPAPERVLPPPPPPAPPAPPPRQAFGGPVAVDPAIAVDGDLARVMQAIARKDTAGALAIAKDWRTAQPGDVLAWVGLGEAYEAIGDRAAAARAYGSIIDLHPSRAEFRRFAGERLERIDDSARKLALDTYRRAAEDRPDQAHGHRLLAYALVRANDHAGAFAAILKAVEAGRGSRAEGAHAVYARDAGMIGTAYIARGAKRADVEARLGREGLALVSEPTTRFVVTWESDANDMDLIVRDAHGNEAWYSQATLPTGGKLLADVRTGWGPECFEITGKPKAAPYTLSVHYFSQGAMGYGLGLLQVVKFDGRAFAFEDRPFVITQNEARVSLGNVR